MKKLLVLALFSSLIATAARSQNWFSADHRWVFHLSGGFAAFDFDFEMVADIDTTIQGHPSRKWVFNSNGYYTLAPKYTYSDGPRAYYFDTRSDSFIKIYDFSLSAGSQVKIPKEFGEFTYQIDTVDVVQAGDLTLKRQRAHYVNPDGQPTAWKFDILENIGMVGSPFEVNYPTCSFVLIPDFECASIADGIDMSFLCFSTPAGSFNPYSGTCTVVKVDDPGDNTFRIDPNPASDYVQIYVSSNSEPQSITLSADLSGKKLRTWEGGQPQFSLQGLPAGIYFLEVTFKNGSRAVKKLIKV